MAISHVKSNIVPDWTGTVTVGNSTGGTQTIAATDLVRPTDWNSAHNQFYTLSGNTNGASTASGTNVVLSGGNNVTLVGGGATVGFSVGNYITTGALSNHSHGNPTLALTNLSGTMDSNSAGLTLSLSAADPGGGAAVTRNYFNPQDGYLQVAGQQGNASMHMQPVYAPNVTFDRIAVPLQVTNATNSTGTVTVSMGFGIYSRNNSTMSLISSTSGSVAVTFSGTVNNSTYSGLRLATIPWAMSLSEDQYYVGIWSRTTTGGANATVNQFLASQMNSTFAGFFGSSLNASMQYTRGLGHYSATFSTAIPSSVGLSQLSGTASIVLRQPVFYFVNGTF
jgi:hypothetical protein